MAPIPCPRICDHGLVYSYGDGWEEWDECPCCNPNGNNDTGTVTKRRLAQFEKQEAAEAEHWEKLIAVWQADQEALDREYGPEHVY